MARQTGFTLIELIVVILLLGILAATAAPRLISFDRDARLAGIDKLYAAMKTAADGAYLKASVIGAADMKESYCSSGQAVGCDRAVTFQDGYLELKYGYPEAHADSHKMGEHYGIVEMLSLDDSWQVCYSWRDPDENGNCRDENSSRVKIGYDATDDSSDSSVGCFVRYREPEGTGNEGSKTYLLEKVTGGC